MKPVSETLAKDLLTVPEAVEYCAANGVKIGWQAIHNNIRREPRERGRYSPKLIAEKKGQNWQITRESLDAFIAYKLSPKKRPRPSVRTKDPEHKKMT